MLKFMTDPFRSGPCKKQVVTATLVTLDERQFRATNYCEAPQSVCPRGDMPSGVGYHLCSSICRQPAHAEVNAVLAAGLAARGSTIYVEGHTYICPSCVEFCKTAGVREVIIGPPPAA